MPTEPVSFTLDVEPHAADPTKDDAYPRVTRQILEWLADREIRGTVFIVGEAAAAHPELVTEAAALGHEVGLHSWDHAPLTTLSRDEFRADTVRGKELLEDLLGEAVVGYRAPTFSLVRETMWTTDVLFELGFTYSSSVLPARNPLYGFPGLPRDPFTWPSGLVELPCPLARVGPLAMPYMGGVYLRVLPWPLVAAAHKLYGGGPAPLTYCHPYDFDPDEPYWHVPETPKLLNRLLWVGRKGMYRKVERLMATGVGPPLRERLDTATALGAVPIPEPEAA